MKNAARPFYKSNDRTHDTRPAFALRPIAYFVMLACCDAAMANPHGPQVVSGNVQMQGLGTNNLTVTNSPGSIINWQGFSIGAGQITQFVQQSSSSAVLNRVVGPDISQIQGQLQSNGRVFLINPAGIVVGAGAVIDTAGFVGSTLNMLDADFLAGRLRFTGDANAGSITNHGYIKTTHGGNVVLVAPNIENSGIIQTDDGKILLAAGRKLTIGSLDANDVQFEVQAPTDSVLNVGQLLANGGAVGVFAGTLRHTGDIRANALTRDEAGRIVLQAKGDVTLAAGSRTSADGKSGGAVTVQSTGGTTIVSGEVSATGTEGRGGDVRLLGERVGVFGAAVIDASGAQGGGQILVGGDYRGGNADVQNASQAVIGAHATLRADATQSGDGGRVIVWADGYTQFAGTASAHGTSSSGNGGFVETSGKEFLTVAEGSRIDVGGGFAGRGGTWLLDPRNITVQTGGAAAATAVDQFSDTPTTDVTVSPATLNGLPVGSTVQLQANNNITFASTLTLTGNRGLNAQAGNSIFVNANISSADSTGITLTANTSGAGFDATQRAAGAATITMAPGVTISQGGGGDITLRMNNVGTSGNIVLANLTATDNASGILVQQNGGTAGSSIVRANASSLITSGTRGLLLENTAGGAASIGTSAEPIRVNTPVLDARNMSGTGGIFIDSQRNSLFTVGSGILDPGSLTGVQAPAGGPIVITTPQNLTLALSGAGAAAPCGATQGGPICSGPATPGVNDTVTLRALDMNINSAIRGSTVTLLPSLVTSATNNQVNLIANPATNSHLHINQAEINQISTSLLRIGDASSGDVSFVDPSTTFNAALVLPANTALEITTGGSIISGIATNDVIAPNTNVTLTAGGAIGATGNRMLLNPGTGTVNLSATTGGIFVQHTVGALDLARYVVATPASSVVRTLELATTDGNITAGGSPFAGPFNVNLITGGAARTITLPAGTFNVNSLTLSPTAPTTLSGTEVFNGLVSSSAGIVSTGTATFNAGLTLTGGAGLTVNGGGTTTINNTASSMGTLTVTDATFNVNANTTVGAAMALSGTGLINVNGAATTLTLGAGGTWQGNGTMAGAGTVRVNNLALAISDPQNKGFRLGNLAIANGASLNWSGGNMSAGEGGTVTIETGGAFNITNDNNWFLAGGSSGAITTLNNAGTITRSTTTGTAALDAMVLNGAGQLDIANGTLRLSGSAGTTAGNITGLIRPFNGTTLEFGGGTYTHSGGMSGNTPGVFGNLTISGGSFTSTGAIGEVGNLTISNATANFAANATAINPLNVTISGATTAPNVTFARTLTDKGVLTISAGTTTINANSTVAGATTFTGGTIAGTGNLALNGAATWGAGTMTGSGITTANAGLTLNTAGIKALAGGRALVNAAPSTATWSGGAITLAGGAGVDNVGIWNDQTTAGNLTNAGGAGNFTNTGTYQRNGAGATTVGVAFNHNNPGNVDILAGGTLILAGGGASTRPFAVAGELQFAANYSVNGGSIAGAGTTHFSGGTTNIAATTYNMATGTTRVGASAATTANFIGATTAAAGAIQLGDGTLNFSVAGGAATATSLDMSGGTLTGTNALTVSGLTTWTAGTMTTAGGGSTITDGGMALTGAGTRILTGGRALTNPAGDTVAWSGNGTLQTGGGSVITNAGTWDDQNAGAATINNASGGGGTFLNTGTYTKSGAGTTTITGVAFNNTGGTVNGTAGTLRISGGGTSTGNLSPGTGGTLELASTLYNITGGNVNGAGTMLYSGATTMSGGTYNAATGGAATVPTGGSLTVSGGATGGSVGALTVSGGTITLSSAEAMTATSLAFSSGTLGGTDLLTVTGAATWTGGTMTGGGTTRTIGGLALSGNGTTRTLSGGRTLENGAGTATWTGTGGIALNNATILNGALWADQSTGASITTTGGGTGTFVNTGTYTKSVDTGTTTIANGVAFNNTGGTVNGTAGTLRISGGGTSTGNLSPGAGGTLDLNSVPYSITGGTVSGAGTLLHTGTTNMTGGTYNVGAAGSTTVPTGGTLNLGGGSTGASMGNLTISGGTVDLSSAEAITATTLVLSSGTLSGSDLLTVTGAATWTGGTMSGSGTTRTTGGLALSGNGTTRTLSGGRTLDNAAGTATWTGNGGIALNNATLANAGLWADQSSGASITTTGGGSGTFTNTGTYTRSVDTGTTIVATGVAFNNTGGTVNVDAGTLRLNGGGTSTGALTPGAGGTLDLNSAPYSITAGTVGGAGTVLHSGTTNMTGGTYNNAAGFTGVPTGGTLNLGAGATGTSVGNLTINGGTANLSSGEALAATTLTLTAGSLGGTDRINVSGLTTWSGGTMTGAGITNADGGLTLDGGTRTLTLGRELINAAGDTANWTVGTLAINDGAFITNNGTFADQTAGGVMSHTGTAASSFVNTGTYTKSAAGMTVVGIGFANTGGSVNVNAGTLSLRGGGSSTGNLTPGVGATLDFNSGTFNITGGNVTGTGTMSFSAATVNVNGGNYAVTGATTQSGGTATFNAGANVTNVGALTLGNGLLTLNSGEAVAASSLTQTGGTLSGTDTINVSGATAWSGGTMTGAGTTNANGGLTLGTGGSNKVLAGGRTLTNTAGQTATWTGTGGIQIAGTATINNFGTWDDATSGGIMSTIGAGSTGVFNNAGTYVKSGTGTSAINAEVTFNNNAAGSSLAVNAGTLRMLNSGTSSRPMSANGGTLEFATGNYTLNAGATVGGTGTVLVSSGTLTVNSPIAFGGTLQMTGGTIDAASPITLSNVFDWSAGTIQGNGLLTTSGNTAVTGLVTLTDKSWTNSGTVTMSGNSRITLGGAGAATLTNTNSFIDSSTNATPISQNTTPVGKTFVNSGTFTKTATSTPVQNIDIAFNNAGTLNVDSGRLQLTAGGTHTGAFVLPAVLEFGGGTHDFNSGGVSGAGMLVLSTGTLNIAPALTTATTLRVAGGTLNDSSGLTLNGNFEWLAGTIAGNGLLTTGAASTSTVTGNVTLAGKSWDNFGSATVGPTGSIGMSGASANAINNRAGANLTVTSTTSPAIFAAAGAGAKMLVNAGTFTSNPGAVTSTINLPTTNTGTITVQSGTLALTSFPTNDGTLNVNAGATYSTGGAALTNAAGATLNADGTLNTGGAALTNNGTVGGAGTINLGGATLTNTGTLRPGSAAGDTTGTLSITGNLMQTTNSQVNFELGGTGAGNSDVVAVSGTATLTGTANVTNVAGYTPTTGDAFQVITAGTRVGNFRAVNKTFATPMRAAYAGLATPGLRFTIGGDNIVNWVAGDGDWTIPGNWDLGHVPGAGEIAMIDDGNATAITVTIPAGTYNPDRVASMENLTISGGTLSVIGASSVNGTLTIGNNGALRGTGPFTVTGTLALADGTLGNTGGVTVAGTTTSSGAVTLGGPLTTTALSVTGGTLSVGAGTSLSINGTGGSTVATSATLANSGTLAISNGTFTVAPGATFTNASTGSLQVASGSATLNGFTSNPGNITLGAGSSLTTSGGTFTNSGTIVTGTGSTFATSGNPLTNMAGSTISGTGTFNLGGTAVFTNNGILVPGTSPGTMTITGGYTQSPTGVLNMELAGLTPGTQYDVLNISGPASLAGTLNVATLNGFVPVFGNRFDIITYASRVGDFTTINFPGTALLQAQPGATIYTLVGFGVPRDNTADELKRLTDELQRVAALETVEEPKFKGGRQICQ